jgi:hypothetical protein
MKRIQVTGNINFEEWLLVHIMVLLGRDVILLYYWTHIGGIID